MKLLSIVHDLKNDKNQWPLVALQENVAFATRSLLQNELVVNLN
jgi:hypothetical protein